MGMQWTWTKIYGQDQFEATIVKWKKILMCMMSTKCFAQYGNGLTCKDLNYYDL